MGATPLYLAIILARAKAYSQVSATLRVSGTVGNWQAVNLLYTPYIPCCSNALSITLAQKNLLQVIEKCLDNYFTFCIHCTRHGITILLECLCPTILNPLQLVQCLVWHLS